jgi:hypothetical protein
VTCTALQTELTAERRRATTAEAAAEAATRGTATAEATAEAAEAAATRLTEELHAAQVAAAEAAGRLEATVAYAAQYPIEADTARVLSDRTNLRVTDKASSMAASTTQLASAERQCELLHAALTDARGREEAATAAAAAAAAADAAERETLDAARRAVRPLGVRGDCSGFGRDLSRLRGATLTRWCGFQRATFQTKPML